MEKALGELKDGFGLDRLPCGQLPANAAYRQAFKSLARPKGWEKFEIKELRFRLLCRAAKLLRHAGQTVLKLSRGCAHFSVFERARWAVLSPLAAGCG
ncbi:MAG: hypothetical protein A2X36_04125 [Elusimicrobia bacterium GWA2_69_24]|nr:MAG: hypothetical protein A2X36_04125 [Elusimicrobia bacterium GWA2_69_24]